MSLLVPSPTIAPITEARDSVEVNLNPRGRPLTRTVEGGRRKTETICYSDRIHTYNTHTM